MKKVLVVDDNVKFQEYLKEQLDGKAIVISAFSIEEAENLFNANSDISAIVMDGCVPGNVLNTPPLVKKFRKAFQGLMIAASSNWLYNLELLDAGCDWMYGGKKNMPPEILELLGA